MLKWTIWTAAAAVALATLLPLIRRDAWWIRACEFPRPQLLVAAVAILVAVPFAGESRTAAVVLAGAMGACVSLQASRILPFTPLWFRRDSPRLSSDGREMLGILVSNILMTNRASEPFLARVRQMDPDLLLVVEADRWWRDALEPLRVSYPYSIEHPQEDTYGLLLYSKLPLEDAEIRALVDDDVPSLRCSVVSRGASKVTFYGLHPKPPAPQEAASTTQRDAELLLVAKEVRGAEGPTVVAGDLNDVAWSYTTRLFRRISGMLDPRIGRGLFATFPSSRPWLRFPLDHLFHSADLGLVDLRCVPVEGSDHLSVYARVGFASGVEAADEVPTPESGDLALAGEKIDRGLRDDP